MNTLAFTIMLDINPLIWTFTYVFDLCHAYIHKRLGTIYDIKTQMKQDEEKLKYQN